MDYPDLTVTNYVNWGKVDLLTDHKVCSLGNERERERERDR